MNKYFLAASVSVVAMAGLAWAAAGGMGKAPGNRIVRLSASSQIAAAYTPTVQASPTAVADGTVLAADGKHIVDAYICVFRAGAVGRGNERAEANRAANAAGGSIGHVYDVALQGFSVHASARGVEQMQRNNARIDYCEQDAVATIVDPINIKAQPSGGATQPAQTIPQGIGFVNGGNTTSTHTAFVIDTGIDLNHPDLNVAAQGNGNDGNSANFVSRETSANDLNGHGSHVSGTIAAKLNTIGVVGVAPGSRLVAVRVLDRRGSGSYSDVIAGVNYVATFGKPGDVANMSLGGPISAALDSAVVNASGSGIWFALAAGNETDDAVNHSPGRVNGPFIRTVAAFNSVNWVWASFSNYNLSIVDYAEPGVSVYSTWKDGGYNTISGTSMATPHMAGILLLGGPATATTFVTRTGTSENYPIGKL